MDAVATDDDDGPVVRVTNRCPACRTLLPADAYFCGACGEHIRAVEDETRVRWRLPSVEPDDTRAWFPFGAPNLAVRSGSTLPSGRTADVLDDASATQTESEEVAPGFGDRPIQPGDSLTIELFCPQCGQRLGIPIGRFLADFMCPRCGTVEQAASLVPRSERLIPAPFTTVVPPTHDPGPALITVLPVVDEPLAVVASTANELPELEPPAPAPSRQTRQRSSWTRLLGYAARLDDLTRGGFGWSVVASALVINAGQIFAIQVLQHSAWFGLAGALAAIHLLVLLSRLRDDAGMITRRSAWAQVRPALGVLWGSYRAAWERDASVYEASWKRVSLLFYGSVLVGAAATVGHAILSAIELEAGWAVSVQYFTCGGMAGALLHLVWQWRRRGAKVRAVAAASDSVAREMLEGSTVANLSELRERVFDLRRPDRARALAQQLGDCLLAHLVTGLAAWPPRVAKNARELEIQVALRRHLKRHLERALGPVGAGCVHERVRSIQDERTDRPGRADLQVENIMIEVKKALPTTRDRERALEQTGLYVRGWTLRTAEGAQRGPVLLVVTQADATFERDFEQLLSARPRADLPYLIVAAGYR